MVVFVVAAKLKPPRENTVEKHIDVVQQIVLLGSYFLCSRSQTHAHAPSALCSVSRLGFSEDGWRR